MLLFLAITFLTAELVSTPTPPPAGFPLLRYLHSDLAHLKSLVSSLHYSFYQDWYHSIVTAFHIKRTSEMQNKTWDIRILFMLGIVLHPQN